MQKHWSCGKTLGAAPVLPLCYEENVLPWKKPVLPWKKNRIYLEKAQKINVLPWKKKTESTLKKAQKIMKNLKHTKCLKSQNQTWKACYRYLLLAHKNYGNTVYIICIIFLTSSSLLTSQFTSRLAANQMYEVT